MGEVHGVLGVPVSQMGGSVGGPPDRVLKQLVGSMCL